MSDKERLALDPEPDPPNISILCVRIGHLNKNLQFVICTITVFVFFLLYGYMQELIFVDEGFKPHGWFLTLVQFGFYTIFGFIETSIRHINKRKIPLGMYLLLAALTLGTMGLSNSSVGYLNYPTQVIFKCCKLIPVMAGSILIQGKRYGPLDFSAALLMCIGLTLFTLADSQVQPNFNTTGIVMISMALLCDAVIGNVQEKSMKKYAAENAEVVFYSYGIGFIYLLVALLTTGDLLAGLEFYTHNPKRSYGYTLIFSLTGYLGIQTVLTLVRTCGAFAAATVTTCRKAVTIIMSFMFFSKPFTMQYLWSGLLVILGIYLNLFSKKYAISFSDLDHAIARCFRTVRLRLMARKYQYGHYMMSNV